MNLSAVKSSLSRRILKAPIGHSGLISSPIHPSCSSVHSFKRQIHRSRPVHATPGSHTGGPAHEPPPDSQLGEAELESLFSDLFTSPASILDPSPLSITPENTSKDPMAVLNALQKRFKIAEPSMSEETTPSQGTPITNQISEVSGQPSYLEVVRNLERSIEAVEAAQPSTSTQPTPRGTSDLGLVAQEEWESLFQSAIEAGDRNTAQRVVGLMKRSGATVERSLEDRILFSYVFAKDIEGVNSYIEDVRQRGEVPTEVQRHLHVEVLVASQQFSEAQKLIHHYENKGLVPSQSTYRNLISGLFAASLPSSSARSPQYRALAWDMFAHMRYVAHPTPSLDTYNTMLQACADAISPSPQRAMDLFHEMTVENRIRPTTATYNAVMLTCARSGKKDYMQEAYRLGKQLLDEYHHVQDDGGGAKQQLQPDLDTFKAMLEAAKRMGDLPRARWILAELVRLGERVDEELMSHVFHVYASFKPTVSRGSVRTVNQNPLKETGIEVDTEPVESLVEPGLPAAQLQPHAPLVPQSRDEVLREARALFQRIIRGQEVARMGDMWTDTAHPDWPFSTVKITTNLMNAYLSVHLNHSAPVKAVPLFTAGKDSLYTKFHVAKNSQAFATVLERLAVVKGRNTRKEVMPLADEVWKEWIAYSTARGNVVGPNKVSPRRIESVWATMVRIVTLAGETDRAVQLVKEFVAKYPPRSVLPVSASSASTQHVPAEKDVEAINGRPALPKSALPTRVSLVASQPLVRLTTNSKIPDTSIPPFLCFKDLEILHHRLVAESEVGTVLFRRTKTDALRFLTWVCKSYEGHLRRKREWVIKKS
ncbi:hypothetical protein FRB90_003226 [Tulasnella sp. 427]|nr:hypothetical protein FRB90_003226 [Tulasnella sp. 427]